MSHEVPTYPHCDPRVLHSPGQCIYCDEHKDWQEKRIADKVNFTGQNFEGLSLCPADRARGIGLAHQWEGNQPRVESDYGRFSSAPLEYPAPAGGFSPRPTFWQLLGAALKAFFLWPFYGHVCPQCEEKRTGEHCKTTLYDDERENICNDCGTKNRIAYYARKDAAERDARIEEMAEAIRRSGCVKKSS